jgi:hypothetical protein
LRSFPFYDLKNIQDRLYTLKSVFKYEPRDDTAFSDVFYDTAMIERDFEKAEQARLKREQLAKAQISTANAKARSNARRR